MTRPAAPTYRKKVDSNHADVVDALRKAGWKVLDMHKCGYGVFDIIAKKTVKVWCEIKEPGKDLTDAEREFLRWVPGRAIIVYGAEDAIEKLTKVEANEPL